MASKKKLLLPVAIVWVAAIVGAGFLGSFALLKMAGLPASGLHWGTFFDAYAYYGGQVAYKKYLAAGAVGTALPLIVALVLSVAMLMATREKKSLYGNARLANDRDLAKSGFLPNEKELKAQKYPALLIGKITKGRYGGRYLLYSGQQFLMLYAPTRSGKGVGIVIPNCIWYEGCMVILDIKLENYLATAGYRQKVLKQDVYLFCPDGYVREIDGQYAMTTHRYNPLFYIRRDAVYRFGDLDKIGGILFPTTGGDNDTWSQQSKNVFMSLVLYLLDTELEKNHKVNMNTVLKLSVPADGSMLGKWFNKEIQARNGEKNLQLWKAYHALPEVAKEGKTPELYPLSEDTVRLFRQFAAKEPKQQESIMLDFNNVMSLFGNPVVAAATEENDFDLRDVRRKKMTVYYGLAPSAIGQYAKLTNLFFSQLLNENIRTLPEHDPSLKYQCTLVLDEFTSMGRLDVVQISLAFTAGYNLRFVFILQNKEQLFDDKKGYGKNGGETILKNCAVELFYPPKKVDDSVKDVSETIGYYDFIRTQITHTTGKQSSKTRSKQIEKRAVLLPQEIVDLRDVKHKGLALKQIVLSEFTRPFIADKIVSFDEKKEGFFTSRKKIAFENEPLIPPLHITQDEVVRQLQLQQERENTWLEEKAAAGEEYE